MPSRSEHFDFFVSYARQDNRTGWITRFVEELLAEHRRFAAGRELKPFFDQHAITAGADWQLYLDRTGVIYGVHGLGGIGKSELAFA